MCIVGLGCASNEPSPTLLLRQNWVTQANDKVLAYACPEAQRDVLNGEDPLMAAMEFVRHGKELEGWAKDDLEAGEPTPENLVAPMDSLQKTIGLIAKSFAGAASYTTFVYRECYGEFPLNCTKLPRARNVLGNIDSFTLRPALEAYFRQRDALAEIFERAGAPRGEYKSCAETFARSDEPRA